MTIAILCTAVLGLLIFGLGVAISLRRLATKAFYSGAGGPTDFTTKLSRSHGNTAEFAPFLALLFLVVAYRHPSGWADVAMVGATVSRVLVVIGFLTSPTLAEMSLPKAIGAVGTYGFGLILTGALLVA